MTINLCNIINKAQQLCPINDIMLTYTLINCQIPHPKFLYLKVILCINKIKNMPWYFDNAHTIQKDGIDVPFNYQTIAQNIFLFMTINKIMCK